MYSSCSGDSGLVGCPWRWEGRRVGAIRQQPWRRGGRLVDAGCERSETERRKQNICTDSRVRISVVTIQVQFTLQFKSTCSPVQSSPVQSSPVKDHEVLPATGITTTLQQKAEKTHPSFIIHHAHTHARSYLPTLKKVHLFNLVLSVCPVLSTFTLIISIFLGFVLPFHRLRHSNDAYIRNDPRSLRDA